MIINSNKLENNTTFEADLCIIGSGPASLTIVKDMQQSGLNILVLSGGEYKITKKNQNLYKGYIRPKNSHEPLDQNRHRVFGGSGNFWGGRCVPMDEIDFKKRDWIPNSGWPIKYSELKPYYKLTSKLFKIGSFKSNSFSKENYRKEIIKMLDDSYITSTKIEQWSPILNFAREYKYLFFKKNITLLNNAHAIKISTSKNKVTSIVAISNNKKVIIKASNFVLACGGIENPRLLLASRNNLHPKGIGNKKNLVGRYYMSHHTGIFLNLNPYDREKILYQYEKKTDGTYWRRRWWITEALQRKKKIGNLIFYLTYTDDLKGMGQNEYIYSFVHLTKFILSIYQNIISKYYKFSLEKREKKLLINNCKIIIKNFFILIPKIIIIAFQRLKKNRLPSILPEKDSKFFGLFFQGEQTPCYNSRITLIEKQKDSLGMPKVKVEISFNENDKKTILKAYEYFIQRYTSIKAGDFQKKNNRKTLTKLLQKKMKNFNSLAHHSGTTRMAKNDRFGVIDKNCKVFGFKNLFIAGSSVFPTVGHANPTFTIIALALRLSDYLQKKFKK